MNTQTSTSEYLLLGRGTHWDKGLSPEEIQKVMRQSNAWFVAFRDSQSRSQVTVDGVRCCSSPSDQSCEGAIKETCKYYDHSKHQDVPLGLTPQDDEKALNAAKHERSEERANERDLAA